MKNIRSTFSIHILFVSIFVSLFLITILPQNAAYASTKTASPYRALGNAQGQGDVQSSIVGPGPTSSSQREYMAYTYVNGTMDLVAVDPATGAASTYTSPVSSEQGAWGMGVGPDHNLYLGTLPNAHLLKFDPRLNRLSDIGRVPSDPTSGVPQNYIWQISTSPYNHTMYACTYPSADLVSYDPLAANPQIRNLGTMDPTHSQSYLHACMADPNAASPFIYLGLGSVAGQIAVYNIQTGTVSSRIAGASGFGKLSLGVDGKIHGTVPPGLSGQRYMLDGGTITATGYMAPAPTNVLSDGSTIDVSATTVTVTSAAHNVNTFPYTYTGKNLSIFRVGAGPDQKIYGGTAMPYSFFSQNPANTAAGVKMQGQVGYGEPYSFLSYEGQLHIASYASPALGTYDPAATYGANQGPQTVAAPSIPTDLRAQAMVGGPNHHIYIGAIASYGQLNGPLISWNTLNNSDIQQYYPVLNQGVSSLAMTTKACQGNGGSACLLGATTVYGGGGSAPATTTARLFSWNTTTNTLVHSYTLPNVGAINTITDLVAQPSTGYVYGIANTAHASYVFSFNPATGKFINGGTKLPFAGTIYNGAALYKGKILGLTSQGVFTINPNKLSATTLVKSPAPITAGFALQGSSLYYASNSQLWSYKLS